MGWVCPALAEPPTASLAWDDGGNASCISEREFRAGVAERMGYDPFRSEASRVLSVRISSERRHRAVLALSEVSTGRALGLREIEDSDCAALRDSLVLAATLGLDPLSGARSPGMKATKAAEPKEGLTLSSVSVAAQSAAPAARAPERDEGSSVRSSKRVSLRVSVGAQFLAGVVPGPGFGPSASLGLRYGRLGVDLEGATTVSGTSSSSDGGAQATSTVASLLPCYRAFASGPWAADVCGVFTAGALFSRGVGVSHPDSRTDAIVLTGLRVAAEWRLTRALGLAALAEGLFPLWHDELSVDDGRASEVVWKTPAASFVTGLSAFALLP
jgi:hypothetical protein